MVGTNRSSTHTYQDGSAREGCNTSSSVVIISSEEAAHVDLCFRLFILSLLGFCSDISNLRDSSRSSRASGYLSEELSDVLSHKSFGEQSRPVAFDLVSRFLDNPVELITRSLKAYVM